MKSPITIVGVLLILAIGAMEVSAQNRSSATQTVTFGVQRSATIIAANFQASATSIDDISLTSAIPLKVTAGSDASSDIVADLGGGGADRSVTKCDRGFSSRENVYQNSLVSRKATVPIAMLRNHKSNSSDRLVITLTE
ncbi:MAG: hypothetical protein Q8P51_18925 [Ignavibacteria bacterium]|nr:hypothetical protein [Ignavibacteria bacterium]